MEGPPYNVEISLEGVREMEKKSSVRIYSLGAEMCTAERTSHI